MVPSVFMVNRHLTQTGQTNCGDLGICCLYALTLTMSHGNVQNSFLLQEQYQPDNFVKLDTFAKCNSKISWVPVKCN